MTRWQKHVLDWKNCRRCPLHARRQRVVLAKGSIPCDVLFVGEGPGSSEDIIGDPFVGPAGKLLDWIVERSMSGTGLSTCFSNLLACLPVDDSKEKLSPLPPESVLACAPRLVDLVSMARPGLIVCVGTEARDWLDPKLMKKVPVDRDIPRVHIVHPSFILQATYAAQGLHRQRCVVTLRDAAEDLVAKKVASVAGAQPRWLGPNNATDRKTL